jgi:hypothetical protein
MTNIEIWGALCAHAGGDPGRVVFCHGRAPGDAVGAEVELDTWLFNTVLWSGTPQGLDFWRGVYDRLSYLDPPLRVGEAGGDRLARLVRTARVSGL